MPRCIFCDEWAGPDADRHRSCALEFERQMQARGLFRRAMAGLGRMARRAFAFLMGRHSTLALSGSGPVGIPNRGIKVVTMPRPK